MNTLNLILQILSIAAEAAQGFLKGSPEGSAADALAQSLMRIAQAAAQAHQQVTGKPIDLTLLNPIDPL